VCVHVYVCAVCACLVECRHCFPRVCRAWPSPPIDVAHMPPYVPPPDRNPTSRCSRHCMRASTHRTSLLQPQRDGLRPSHQPLFGSPGTPRGATGSAGGGGNASGGADGETGEVGDLFNDLSGDEGGSFRHADESSAAVEADGGGGGDDHEHGNSGSSSSGQHTATNIDAVFAEFEQGDDEDVGGGGGGGDGMKEQHAPINMDCAAEEIGRESGGGVRGVRGTDRKSRRLTADKGDFQSLLGSLESPASSAAALGAAGTPAAGSDSMVAEDDETGGHGGAEDTTAQVVRAGSWGALDTPEASVHRREKRRETADASELQNFFQSPTGVTPTSFPAASAAATAAGAMDTEVGASSSSRRSPPAASPSNGQQQQRQRQLGAAQAAPSGSDPRTSSSPISAAAAATPGSGRSSATAVSMKGVFELASPPGQPTTSASARGAAAEQRRRQQRRSGQERGEDPDSCCCFLASPGLSFSMRFGTITPAVKQ